MRPRLLCVDKGHFTIDRYEWKPNYKGENFIINVYPDVSGYGFWATVAGYYDGTNGGIFANYSLESREAALQGMTEKLSEAIYEEKI